MHETISASPPAPAASSVIGAKGAPGASEHADDEGNHRGGFFAG
jgi:hypothetical protein